MGSWEQTAQERSKWRGLINKGAALYEKKRICEAERKRRERKAKTNVPPSDSMTLTCSTCNRQFRARIGIVSHQRTHQHTSALFKKIMMVFLISERRTIRHKRSNTHEHRTSCMCLDNSIILYVSFSFDRQKQNLHFMIPECFENVYNIVSFSIAVYNFSRFLVIR